MEIALVDLGFGALLEKIEEYLGQTALWFLLCLVFVTLAAFCLKFLAEVVSAVGVALFSETNTEFWTARVLSWAVAILVVVMSIIFADLILKLRVLRKAKQTFRKLYGNDLKRSEGVKKLIEKDAKRTKSYGN